MKRFAALYARLDSSTRSSEKRAALIDYFREAPAEDAAWTLAIFTGRRPKRAVSYPRLREWVAQEAKIPLWLVAACHERVGDFGETITLLLPGGSADTPGLAQVIRDIIQPMTRADDDAKRAVLLDVWRTFPRDQLFVFHKLISGTFRVGVQRKMVVRALAEAFGIDPGVMDHRLLGAWEPTAIDFARLIDPDATLDDDDARPYPFFLASPIEDAPGDPHELPNSLGNRHNWLAEWKWDGIRAQLIKRAGPAVIWTRGEESVAPAYPELVAAAESLPEGTVLDGEILAYDPAKQEALPFQQLQRRLNRKSVQPTLFAPDVPIVFMAYDLLESRREDQRERSLIERRARLESLFSVLDEPHIRLSPRLSTENWEQLERLREESRERRVEGVMLKRNDSPYRSGRPRGDWWKWKIDPYSIDCVLTAAQPGSGRRAGLFTDYTFAVWHRDELINVTKAYSGLSDDEFKKVDAFVRANTLERFGPVRTVTPELVFEIHFEGIQASQRNGSGIALRFPRMHRWRTDKKPADADRIETLRSLLEQVSAG
ncbi:MAG: ATP-dependent DNA ligase [Planctomycetota bacterium]